MIIVDFNQVAIASIMMQSDHTRAPLELSHVRRMILNSLRSYKVKFGKTYGEMVIATDARNLWRKAIFPFYKARRKTDQELSPIDWAAINKVIGTLREEFTENLPYKFLHVDQCEADDIIAALVQHCEERHNEIGLGESVLIISKDKDFIQLHSPTVWQYNPIDKDYVGRGMIPDRYLFSHICKGDRGDGIPNVLSADNTFVTGGRQGKLTEKRLQKLDNPDSDIWTEEVKRNFARNNMLINLMYVPKELTKVIINQYISATPKSRSTLPVYLMKHKLKDLVGAINEF